MSLKCVMLRVSITLLHIRLCYASISGILPYITLHCLACCPRRSVILPAELLEMRKPFLNPFLGEAEIEWRSNFEFTLSIFIAHDAYKNTWVKLHYNYTCTYLFFILCIEFLAAHLQTKFSRSCPHSIEISFSRLSLASLVGSNDLC